MIVMYDPYNHENGFSGSNNNENKEKRPDSEKSSDTYRPVHTEWEDGCYHSVKEPDNPGQSSQYGNYQPYGYVSPQIEKPRKKKNRHMFRKVIAGVLVCMVISAGSIAGFVALVNNGTIQLNVSGDTPAFTIMQSNDSGKKATALSAVGAMTKSQVAKKVIPSVVSIENYQAVRNGVNQFSIGGFTFSFGGDEDGNSGKSETSPTPTSEGSGVIFSSDGYIITNAHVVSKAKKLKVVLSNGKKYEAKLIGSDDVTDLAVIKIDATGLTPATFGSSSELEVGDDVLAIGSPDGEEFSSTVTAGIVSGLDRAVTNSETGYTMNCIQTDAAINPGNSGGALVNMKGHVVGINSSKIVDTTVEGMGFSIPINVAQNVVSELKQYGYVKDRAVLGITERYIDSIDASHLQVPAGCLIVSVTSNKVTAAGIQKGDIITKIDGKAVTGGNVITSEIATKKPGDTVTLNVTRSSTGQSFTAKVELSQATGKS